MANNWLFKNEFAEGDILEMKPTKHSHVTKPYYVLVKYYKGNATGKEPIMITEIPNEHECIMTRDNNWWYHRPRMKKVGTLATHGDLLKFQSLL